MQTEVEEVARKIAAQEFDAKPGFYCTFCAYRSLCPATEKRLYTISVDKKSSSAELARKNLGDAFCVPSVLLW